MRVLLTGARAPATLELARLCARAGHEVHVADTHRWHICRGSRLIAGVHQLPAPRFAHATYATALRRLVDRESLDVIVPTCEEVFHLAAIRNQVGARVVCEPLEVLAPLHDKWRFIGATLAANLRAPRTYNLSQMAELRALPHGPYIVKPRYSRFATQVVAWQSGEPLPAPVANVSGWIAQERLTGGAFCTWSVATHGRLAGHVTYACDETAGVRGAAIAFRSVRHAGVLAWVRQFVAHHRLSGQFAFDFIDAPQALMAIECNPRLTSGVHCFRNMPDMVQTLLEPERCASQITIEPPTGLAFRSRLALWMYGRPRAHGAGLLDAHDDPWPCRLQLLSWGHLLCSAAMARTDPRIWSTHDIEWNGE